MIVTHIDKAVRFFNPHIIAEKVKAVMDAHPEYKARKVQVGIEPDTWVILVTEYAEDPKYTGPLPFVGFVG